MRVLANVRPTPEQLPILQDYRPGFVLIRGAAGSGKTTTAVLRLRHVTGVWANQRDREGSDTPVRVLVLTYNRTLRGYVKELVESQIEIDRFDLQLSTFGRWAWEVQGKPEVLVGARRAKKLEQLGFGLGYPPDFLVDEVDYVLGRYLPDRIGEYYVDPDHPHYDRRGRGQAPRVSRKQRERLVKEVIEPFGRWKADNDHLDWPDIDLRMAQREPAPEEKWDIVVVDEAQDFSANQLRGLYRHLAETHSTTFVLDAIQRVYPRGFGWPEVGIELTHTYRLRRNHRNTRQIAAFALPLVNDLPQEDDGTLPDFESCDEQGEVPTIVRGRFVEQMNWVVNAIREKPEGESVALLHAKGGSWFDFTRSRLKEAGVDFVDLQRREEWPRSDEQVGLSTLHSAKGLEFDHVFILGLAARQMPHGPEENDTQLNNHRRLVAMAIGRARKTVALTYKPGEESQVVHLLDPSTYRAIDV
ncbi:MAG TPA: 3'-5' exonuclease [Solirubrobacterales bacterium]|nr:3'-5' exonuclease [Solirubrobacterales bacterium]